LTRNNPTWFTRKENLEEHNRPRHLEEMSNQGSNRAPSHAPAPISTVSQEPSIKRRRISTIVEVLRLGPGNEVAAYVDDILGSFESRLVQHLREELRQKEEFIRRQAAELHRLQNLLRSLPPQAIYGVMQTRMPGSGVG